MLRRYLLSGISILLLLPACTIADKNEDPMVIIAGQIDAPAPPKWATKITNPYLTNLWKLNDSIYRCEQPDKNGFRYLRNQFGVVSDLNLRSNHKDTEFISGTGISEFNVPMSASSFTHEDIVKALKIIREAPKPLVFHCKVGRDRTGVVAAMYRIVFCNWTKEQALDELVNGGFGFKPSSYPNIPQYITNVDIESIREEINR